MAMSEIEMKQCSICGQIKPRSEFPIRGGRRCKKCTNHLAALRKRMANTEKKNEREGLTCAKDCARYKCFTGIENIRVNLALTCRDFKPNKQ